MAKESLELPSRHKVSMKKEKEGRKLEERELREEFIPFCPR
jgi:hypothetical protein